LDILQDPARSFNGHKLSFQFFPSSGKVLARKEDKMCMNLIEVLHKSS